MVATLIMLTFDHQATLLEHKISSILYLTFNFCGAEMFLKLKCSTPSHSPTPHLFSSEHRACTAGLRNGHIHVDVRICSNKQSVVYRFN